MSGIESIGFDARSTATHGIQYAINKPLVIYVDIPEKTVGI